MEPTIRTLGTFSKDFLLGGGPLLLLLDTFCLGGCCGRFADLLGHGKSILRKRDRAIRSMQESRIPKLAYDAHGPRTTDGTDEHRFER